MLRRPLERTRKPIGPLAGQAATDSLGSVVPRSMEDCRLPDPSIHTLRERKAHEAGQLFLLEVDGEWKVVGEQTTAGDHSPLDLSWLDPGKPTALCRRCPRILPVTCFQSGWDSTVDQPGKGRHADCIICEFEIAELYRQEHCWELAAEQRLRDHMRRERDQGLHACRTFAEYIQLTGIPVQWLADLMRRTWEDNLLCHHCETAGLPAHWQVLVPDPIHDLSRMTIDRTDPTRPLARDNVTIMCLGGNIAKHNTDPRIYNVRQAYWRIHNRAAT